MDLTSLYRMVSSEAPSVPEQMMRGAANQAALQQANESLMANKRLRELYARGNPSIQEIGAISPEYAQKVQQDEMTFRKWFKRMYLSKGDPFKELK